MEERRGEGEAEKTKKQIQKVKTFLCLYSKTSTYKATTCVKTIEGPSLMHTDLISLLFRYGTKCIALHFQKWLPAEFWSEALNSNQCQFVSRRFYNLSNRAHFPSQCQDMRVGGKAINKVQNGRGRRVLC